MPTAASAKSQGIPPRLRACLPSRLGASSFRGHHPSSFNLSAICTDEGGVVAIVTALALTALIGITGLALDVGMWYRSNRAMQNAADAAVIAAALNGTGSYQSEAKAVAAQYGFVDGANGVTVTALNNQTCPDGATDCYQVTVAQTSPPRYFSPVVGNFSPSLAGAAMAGGSQTHSYCLLALGGSGTDPAIRTNGAPKADLTGCSLMSDTGATCNGNNLNATYGDAHKTNNGCGITQRSNVPAVADPYSSLASNIPSTSGCLGLYPQEPVKKKDPSLPLLNQWSIPLTLTTIPTVANHGIVCGDLQLMADVTVTTASPGSLLVIANGQLDTNGHTLKTAPGSALTIIFTGPDATGIYTHAPTGGGTLDFPAPTSGTWKGIALYQDPNLPSGADVNISAAGNSPTWKITGVVYLPHSSVIFSGAVNKSSNGASCLLLVVDNITINGTGSILANGGCAAAGVTLPTNNVGAIALLQ
jgi:Flp pilus assembly protein TadG